MKKIASILPGILSLFLLSAQNVGIGIQVPTGTVDIARGTAANGTAVFRGSTYSSHFNYATAEDSYIRGGKIGSKVIINDGALGNVGVGTASPDFKLTIYEPVIQGNSNTHVLKLKGQNPVLAFADQSDNSYGYIKMWSYQPFAPYTNGLVIGANPGYPIFLSTNNYSATMTIADNGNVGIGTTTPATRLHINRDGEALRLSGSGSYLSLYNGNTYKGYLWSKEPNDIELGTAAENTAGNLNFRVHGIDGLTVQSDGRVRAGPYICTLGTGNLLPRLSITEGLGFKTKSGAVGEWSMYYPGSGDERLVVCYNGGIKAYIDYSDGSWDDVSDARVKENFEPYKPVLDDIKNLNVLTYHYKSGKTGGKSFGLVAQNLRQYFPELVSGTEAKDRYLAIDYGKTGVLAIKAIQEQQEIIEAQEKKIDVINKEIATLKEHNERLLSTINKLTQSK